MIVESFGVLGKVLGEAVLPCNRRPFARPRDRGLTKCERDGMVLLVTNTITHHEEAVRMTIEMAHEMSTEGELVDELSVVHMGEVSYSLDDPDDAWVEAPVDHPSADIAEALTAVALAGFEMIPLDECDPVFVNHGKVRYYLMEREVG